MFEREKTKRDMLRIMCTAWLIMFSNAQDDFCRRSYDVTRGCDHTYGSVLRTLTNIRSVSECSCQCNDNDRCLSIKYDMDRRVCMLNSERYSSLSTGCPVRFKYAELSKSSCRKLINDACTTSSDCSVYITNSQCFQGKCQCNPGYSYQRNDDTCVTTCEEYGSTFTVYPGRHFLDSITKTVLSIDNAEDCQQLCLDETAFVCRSGDHLRWMRICYLSSTAARQESSDLRLSHDTTTHFQRDCQ